MNAFDIPDSEELLSSQDTDREVETPTPELELQEDVIVDKKPSRPSIKRRSVIKASDKSSWAGKRASLARKCPKTIMAEEPAVDEHIEESAPETKSSMVNVKSVTKSTRKNAAETVEVEQEKESVPVKKASRASVKRGSESNDGETAIKASKRSKKAKEDTLDKEQAGGIARENAAKKVEAECEKESVPDKKASRASMKRDIVSNNVGKAITASKRRVSVSKYTEKATKGSRQSKRSNENATIELLAGTNKNDAERDAKKVIEGDQKEPEAPPVSTVPKGSIFLHIYMPPQYKKMLCRQT